MIQCFHWFQLCLLRTVFWKGTVSPTSSSHVGFSNKNPKIFKSHLIPYATTFFFMIFSMLFGRKLFNRRLLKLFSENLKSKYLNVTLFQQFTGEIHLLASEKLFQCTCLEITSLVQNASNRSIKKGNYFTYNSHSSVDGSYCACFRIWQMKTVITTWTNISIFGFVLNLRGCFSQFGNVWRKIITSQTCTVS